MANTTAKHRRNPSRGGDASRCHAGERRNAAASASLASMAQKLVLTRAEMETETEIEMETEMEMEIGRNGSGTQTRSAKDSLPSKAEDLERGNGGEMLLSVALAAAASSSSSVAEEKSEKREEMEMDRYGSGTGFMPKNVRLGEEREDEEEDRNGEKTKRIAEEVAIVEPKIKKREETEMDRSGSGMGIGPIEGRPGKERENKEEDRNSEKARRIAEEAAMAEPKIKKREEMEMDRSGSRTGIGPMEGRPGKERENEEEDRKGKKTRRIAEEVAMAEPKIKNREETEMDWSGSGMGIGLMKGRPSKERENIEEDRNSKKMRTIAEEVAIAEPEIKKREETEMDWSGSGTGIGPMEGRPGKERENEQEDQKGEKMRRIAEEVAMAEPKIKKREETEMDWSGSGTGIGLMEGRPSKERENEEDHQNGEKTRKITKEVAMAKLKIKKREEIEMDQNGSRTGIRLTKGRPGEEREDEEEDRNGEKTRKIAKEVSVAKPTIKKRKEMEMNWNWRETGIGSKKRQLGEEREDEEEGQNGGKMRKIAKEGAMAKLKIKKIEEMEMDRNGSEMEVSSKKERFGQDREEEDGNDKERRKITKAAAMAKKKIEKREEMETDRNGSEMGIRLKKERFGQKREEEDNDANDEERTKIVRKVAMAKKKIKKREEMEMKPNGNKMGIGSKKEIIVKEIGHEEGSGNDEAGRRRTKEVAMAKKKSQKREEAKANQNKSKTKIRSMVKTISTKAEETKQEEEEEEEEKNEDEGGLEVMAKDDAWYAANLSFDRSRACLNIRYHGYSKEEDEQWHVKRFNSVQALLSRIRPLSNVMQDKECGQVCVGVSLCVACHRYHTENFQYYDAVVKKVVKSKHIMDAQGDEECICSFVVEWKKGPLEGKTSTVKCGDICFLSFGSIETDPAALAFLQAVKAYCKKRDLNNLSESDDDENKPLGELVRRTKLRRLNTEVNANKGDIADTQSKLLVPIPCVKGEKEDGQGGIPLQSCASIPSVSQSGMVVLHGAKDELNGEDRKPAQALISEKPCLFGEVIEVADGANEEARTRVRIASSSNVSSSKNISLGEEEVQTNDNNFRKLSLVQTITNLECSTNELKPSPSNTSGSELREECSSLWSVKESVSVEIIDLEESEMCKPVPYMERAMNQQMQVRVTGKSDTICQSDKVGLSRFSLGNVNESQELFKSRQIATSSRQNLTMLETPLSEVTGNGIPCACNSALDFAGQSGKERECLCSQQQTTIGQCSSSTPSEGRGVQESSVEDTEGQNKARAASGRHGKCMNCLSALHCRCLSASSDVDSNTHIPSFQESGGRQNDALGNGFSQDSFCHFGCCSLENSRQCLHCNHLGKCSLNSTSPLQVLIIENMERHATEAEAFQMLMQISSGLLRVFVLPCPDYEAWRRGYAVFADVSSAENAYSILSGWKLFIVSSEGRPWVLSRSQKQLLDMHLPLRPCLASPKDLSHPKNLHLIYEGSIGYEQAKEKAVGFLDHKRELKLCHIRYMLDEKKAQGIFVP